MSANHLFSSQRHLTLVSDHCYAITVYLGKALSPCQRVSDHDAWATRQAAGAPCGFSASFPQESTQWPLPNLIYADK